MKRSGLTQRGLSDLIGVNQPTISRWFNGQKPYSRALNALAEKFKISQALLEDDSISVEDFISKSNQGKAQTDNQSLLDLYEIVYSKMTRSQIVDTAIELLKLYENGDRTKLELVLELLTKRYESDADK